MHAWIHEKGSLLKIFFAVVVGVNSKGKMEKNNNQGIEIINQIKTTKHIDGYTENICTLHSTVHKAIYKIVEGNLRGNW